MTEGRSEASYIQDRSGACCLTYRMRDSATSMAASSTKPCCIAVGRAPILEQVLFLQPPPRAISAPACSDSAAAEA